MRAIVLVLALLATALPVAALPTPGVFCDTAQLATGRVFPEAMESNDFVSYDEAVCGLVLIAEENPERMRIDVVGQSAGWTTVAGARDTFDVFVVRVSDYASTVPDADKDRLVFQLSIHGNEKGGREGGLRVIEDLVREMGYAAEHSEMLDRLSFMEILFVFPNPDGWTHEEAQYRHNDACYFSGLSFAPVGCTAGQAGPETQSFVRVNGNGFDVNRQWPTTGWGRESHQPMSQPEAIALVDYLKRETNVKYASDIHGMMNPADGSLDPFCATGLVGAPDPTGVDPTCFTSAVEGSKGHYVLTMLPAGRQDPREMHANTQLAELVKERLNNDAYFAEWRAVPNSAGGAWGGAFNDWGTVWDTLGYTDSGFTSDWYAQDNGLNAAGVDFELSYNHITFDNYYPGAAQKMNDYHVRIVREIVRAFMDEAATNIDLRVDAKGTKTAYLDNPTVVTNAQAPGAVGWAAQNALDDAWDTGARVYRAAPNDYFADIARALSPEDASAALDSIAPSALARRLALYDNLVVAGGAYKTLDAGAKATIRSWVEAGGNLVLTDESLQMLVDLDLVEPGNVDVALGYAGATNFVDRKHALAQGIRGLARETFEPVPLGFPLDPHSAPNWFVKADGFSGDVVGVGGEGQGATPDMSLVNFGTISLGAGRVSFLGALLPDPVADENTYYALDSYATTYTGNQLLRNMLGWDVVVGQSDVEPGALVGRSAATPASSEDAGRSVPGPALGLVVLALLGLVVLRRR